MIVIHITTVGGDNRRNIRSQDTRRVAASSAFCNHNLHPDQTAELLAAFSIAQQETTP